MWISLKKKKYFKIWILVVQLKNLDFKDLSLIKYKNLVDGIRPSIYTDCITNRNCLLIYTDRIKDEIISVGKNYRWNNFVNNSVGF